MNFNFTEEQGDKFIYEKATKKKHNYIEEDEKLKVVVGLDIGTTKIATVVGVQNEEGKIKVLSYGKGESTGVQHGLIFNVAKTMDGIKTSIKAVLNRFECEIDDVFVGVAGRHIKSIEYKHVVTRRHGKNEIIRQDEMDNIIDDLKNISVNPGEKIIDVIPQHFIIDTHRETIDPVGELGEVMEGYYQIITGNETEINKIKKCVEGVSLNINTLILEPIASGLSCLSLEEKINGVALVDIGGGTTDVAIFFNGKPVFTRVIPIGGSVITNDIASVCRITEEMAEKLKQSHGTCIIEKSNKNNFIAIPHLTGMKPTQISETYLAQIINARVQSGILNEVRKAIIESGYYDKLKKGVVLTGGGANLKHLKDLCIYTLNLPVRIGCPDIGFAPSLYPELKSPVYATSLGLLKFGVSGLDETLLEFDNDDDWVIGNVSSLPKKPKQTPIEGKEESRADRFFKTVRHFLNNVVEKTEEL